MTDGMAEIGTHRTRLKLAKANAAIEAERRKVIRAVEAVGFAQKHIDFMAGQLDNATKQYAKTCQRLIEAKARMDAREAAARLAEEELANA